MLEERLCSGRAFVDSLAVAARLAFRDVSQCLRSFTACFHEYALGMGAGSLGKRGGGQGNLKGKDYSKTFDPKVGGPSALARAPARLALDTYT